jgi:protein-tyrosine kinase
MIPLQNNEVERIYARTLGAGMRSIAITSSNPGEGVTSLAVTLAQRHLLANKSTLFIDLNSDKSEHLTMLASDREIDLGASLEPQILTDQNESYALLGIPAPMNRKVNLAWRNPGTLERYLAIWLEQFDALVVDAGSINRSAQTLIPAERIVAACEETLLVVMAGVTNEPTVRYTCDRIVSAGARLAGCVLNECHNPSLKQELLRESSRIPAVFDRYKDKLNHWIQANRLLSLEI